jgi:hypothetical protein
VCFLQQHNVQHFKYWRISSMSSSYHLSPLALQSSNVDLMQLHMYPDSWLRCNEDCKRDWTIRWVHSHKLSSSAHA